jgi:2-keto-4-pentenoate hydratase/2-oxohepta-3-ene-1,7-dioic acid hydratase in catechol pathway
LVPGPGSLLLSLTVNGAVQQRSWTGQLIFSARQQVAALGAASVLRPGAAVVAGLPDDADAA